jgi:aspartyl-tRNA(Asn)/glutamyl-tRNA(Gln) amidotransferase subunit A
VGDVTIVLRVLTGAAAPTAPPEWTGEGSVALAVAEDFFFGNLHPYIETAVRRALNSIQDAGAVLIPIDLPRAAEVPELLSRIAVWESAAYHARWLDSLGPVALDPVLRQRLESARSQTEADYRHALRQRDEIRISWDKLFERFDALVIPTVPAPPTPRGQSEIAWPDGSQQLLSACYSRLCKHASLTGQPALSMPCGFDDDGLPVGLQVVGALDDDSTLLSVAALIESSLEPVGLPAMTG